MFENHAYCLFGVNAPDADVVFRSSDNVLFHIHSSQLTAITGGFPPADFRPGGRNEMVDLLENARTLELLFQFIYPRPQPVLGNLPFSDLSQLTEAAEKYQVYPAMPICNLHMRSAGCVLCFR